MVTSRTPLADEERKKEAERIRRAGEKKKKFANVDKTLFGSLLPGGDPLQTKGQRNKEALQREEVNTRVTQPVKESTPVANPQAQPTVPEISKGSHTGRRNVTLPDGRNFVGLSKEEAEGLVNNFQAKQQLPAGSVPQGTAQTQLDQQIKLEEALSQLGQVGELTEATPADVNLSQAFTAGLAGAVPGVIGGAVGGAVVSGGNPLIAGGGAILGGVGSFVAGTINNIKTQQRGEIQAAKTELTSATRNMRQLAMLASRDPANADYYISVSNQQLTRLYQAQRQTKIETKGDLKSWMDDGRKDLADFDVFLRPGGLAEIYRQKLETALLTNTPLSIVGDELFTEAELK